MILHFVVMQFFNRTLLSQTQMGTKKSTINLSGSGLCWSDGSMTILHNPSLEAAGRASSPHSIRMNPAYE